MPRKINVITTCFNKDLMKDPSMERNFQKTMGFLDSFSKMKPDIICFPEVFLRTGIDDNIKDSDEITKKAFDSLSERARSLNCYIIAGAHEYIDSRKYNVAWLFNRNGRLEGRYCKCFPTIQEINETQITPGSEMPVFETDFGKLGITICYDIGFSNIWSTLASKGAELIAWISDYDGGFPLQTYAWSNSYYIVSSVRTNHSKIIDKTGRILSSSSRWGGWTSRVIDLDKQIFHTDYHDNKLAEIQHKLGNGVTIENFSEEGIFTLESNDAEWPMERIISEFSLETFKDYHLRAAKVHNMQRRL